MRAGLYKSDQNIKLSSKFHSRGATCSTCSPDWRGLGVILTETILQPCVTLSLSLSLYICVSTQEKVRWQAAAVTGMAWLCYDSEAIWISHKVVRAGILYWQVIIYCALRSPGLLWNTDNLHSKAFLLAEFIKLSEELRARALQNGKVNEVFQ